MKILIAEDEHLCLENLEMLDWASLGIETVLTAQDGKTAYQIALREKPEVILSDIQMPKMSGLELAEKLSVNLPESRFIILTAYNNFTYAQTAISSGVSSYILKPFMSEDVIKTVSDTVKEIKEEKLKNSYNEHVAKQLEISKHFLLSYFFNAISDGINKSNELNDIFGIVDNNLVCTAMVISLEHSKEVDSFGANFRTFNHLTRIFTGHKANFLPFFNTNQLVFFFLSEPLTSPKQAQTLVLSYANAAKTYLNFNYSDKYVIGLGNSVSEISKCETSYNGALNAIKYSFYLGFNSVICISDLEPSDDFIDYQLLLNQEFYGNIKAGNFESATFKLGRLFDDFRRKQAPIKTVQRICNEILIHLSLCLLQCELSPDLIFNKTNVWDVLQQYKSIDALEEFMTDFVDVVISTITFRYNQKNTSLVNKIKDYISLNPDTSLNEISDHFFYSPNYLSNIFSKETGMTIKSYIIAKRMERAKELLVKTEKNIGAIAAEVGYKNAQHFSTVFSKQTGVTPTNYRNSLLDIE